MPAMAESKKFVVPSEELVGDTAGQVWSYLKANGETSLIKLKSELQCTASLIHLSLGWLLREGKLEISNEKGYLTVKLK